MTTLRQCLCSVRGEQIGSGMPDYADKLEAVQNKGEWTYSFSAPPVCTAYWDAADWVRFVDTHGRWYRKQP